MALKKPIVLNTSGQLEQLQSGDIIDTGVGSAAEVESLTNNHGSGMVIGEPVFISSADNVQKARANAVGTSKVIGLVFDTTIANAAAGQIQTDGVLSATTTQWDAVTGQVGGLTAGSEYYLSAATAGRMTTTAPTSVGEFVCPLGIAISTTKFKLSIENTILL